MAELINEQRTSKTTAPPPVPTEEPKKDEGQDGTGDELTRAPIVDPHDDGQPSG